MYNNLRAEMTRAEKTQKELAEAIGVSKSTFNLKITGKTDFKRSEMVTIARELSNPKRPNLSIDYLFDKEA